MCQIIKAKKYAISLWGKLGNDLEDLKYKMTLNNPL